MKTPLQFFARLSFVIFLITANLTIVSSQQFDVALQKTTVTAIPVKYGTLIPFNLTVHNQGTDTIMNVELIDHLGDGYEFQMSNNVDWDFHPTIANAVVTTFTEKIPPNDFRIVTLNLIARPGDSRDDWINVAEVVSFTDVNGINREPEDTDSVGDEFPDNDAGGLLGSGADNFILGDGTGQPNDGVAATDEDDHDRDTIRIFDLALKKELDPIVGYSYGDTLTFMTTVYNQGNMLATQVRVRDYIPEGYINPIAENVALGWTNNATVPVYTIDQIAVGDSAEIEIKLILGTTQVDENAWDNYAEIISARDENLSNVSANDADSTPASNTPEERSIQQGDPDDNYIGNNPVDIGDQDDHDPANPQVFDLALIKERATAVPSFNYNTPVEYTYTVANQGNVTATDIVLVDSLPCGAFFDEAINPDWDYDPATNLATLTIEGPLAGAEVVQGSIMLTVVQCYDDPNTAWDNYLEIAQATTADGIQTTEIDGVFDTNFKNETGYVDNELNDTGALDEDNHDIEVLQVYDVAIKKELITEGPYTEGQILDFRIRAYNQGNVVVEDLIIEDFVPEGLGYDPALNAPLGWTNEYEIVVNGNTIMFLDTLNVQEDVLMDSGDSLDIFIKLELQFDGVDDADWYNYAHVFINTDTLGNRRFDDSDSNPLSTTELEFVVEPGSDEDDNLTSLGKSNDPQLEEDDHDVAEISFFDLSLTKQVISTDIAFGETVDFEIVVENEGTQFAHDITIIDFLPCGLTFTSAGNTGWSTISGTSNIEYFYTDTLRSGESVTIPVTLTLEECDNPTEGNYTNRAEISDALNDDDITGDDQDSTPDDILGNDGDTEDDNDAVPVELFDLSLRKIVTSQSISLVQDFAVDYEIIVKNEGTVVAENIDITEYVPCGMIYLAGDNPDWEVNPVTGNPEYTISSIVEGDSIAVPFTLRIGACANGVEEDFTNVAEISAADGPDGNPGDDTDSTPDDDPDNDPPGEDDIDEVDFDVFDLSLTKISSVSNNVRYGDIVTYTLQVTNEGTLAASNIEITDYIPCGFSLAGGQSNWTLDSNTGYASTVILGPVAPNEMISTSIDLVVEPCFNINASAYNNVAEISGGDDPDGNPGDDSDSTPDDDPDNDNPDEDDTDNHPIDVYDLTLSKSVSNPQQSYEIGDEVVYNITLMNQGNVAASAVEVVDYIPCGASLAPNNAFPWMMVGDYAYLELQNDIGVGASVTVPITLVLSECFANETGTRNNRAEISGGNNPDGTPGNDADSNPDNDPNNDTPGEDDIDEVEINVNVGVEIGDYAFLDRNGNGTQDNGEAGVPDVNVKLYSEFGILKGETTTDANGFYLFESVRQGNYYIVFDGGEELEFTSADIGNDTRDSDVTNLYEAGSTDLFAVTNQDDYTIDAGLYECVLIQGVTYYDINEDDIRQTTENGINGLPVNLYRRVGNTWVLWDSETTHHDVTTPSDDGIWDFCVQPGTYYISIEVPPIGLVVVRPFVGGSNFDSDINGANGPNSTPSFTLQSGGTKTDLGAGFYPMATVGNLVWEDSNFNGRQDFSEPRVADMQVELYNANNELLESTITDINGVYEFDYLQKKDYYLKFIPPNGYGMTISNAADEDLDSDVSHAMGTYTTELITFNPGDDIETVDAGIVQGVLPVVWKDIDVVAEAKSNIISWSTFYESNNDYFTIERSIDGTVAFEAIGRVEARGESTSEFSYAFEDEDIQHSGTYYYRIKQTDKDGSYSHSDIHYVSRKSDNDAILYPNPASTTLHMEYELDGVSRYSVDVYNSIGINVLSQALDSESLIHQISISELSNGVYKMVLRRNGDIIDTKPFIKLD